MMKEGALALINRQKAEIERLEETKNRLSYNLQAVLDERADHSEAIKEFAERVDDLLCKEIGPSRRAYWKISGGIENIIKEMREVKENG